MPRKRGLKPPNWHPKRGDVCLFVLDKERPGVVLSRDSLNRFSRDLCVIPITSVPHAEFSLRPRLAAGEAGLNRDSWAQCDQIFTIEKQDAVFPPLGSLSQATLRRIEEAVKSALQLP
jgi:mRNA interferase MazF